MNNPATLLQAGRNLLRHKLGELAQKIMPTYTWDDIVLPEDIKNHLREICYQLIYQSKVYEDWCLGTKISRSEGLIVLFSGLSGTEKKWRRR